MTDTKHTPEKPRGSSSNDIQLSISADHDRWLKEVYAAEVEDVGERRCFETDTGLAVDPLYSPKSLEDIGFDYRVDVGFPGEYPYTRGDSASMYRTEPFVVSAYSGHGDAITCNKRFHKLIELGVEQILVAFDLPTQCGYDSDDIMSTGEVGRVGVSIDSLADMELLFEGIPLNTLKRVGTLGNSIGPIVLAMFAVLGEKQGLAYDDYVVNLQNDPLKEYLARGTQILPANPAAKLAVDPVAWCADSAPGWSPITVCCNHLNASGAGSTWACALALGNAIHYLDLLVEQGHSIDRIAPLFQMFPDERHDFFVSVATLRALRRVWAQLVRDRYGGVTSSALALRTTVYGHGQETLQEPINNIVRIGFGTLAYVLGGASYVYIASHDEAVGTPTEDTVKVAIRTQQIIAHEHGFTDTIDPLGGSYFVETLTKTTANQIREHLQTIEDIGGALRVIDSGFGHEILNRGAQRRQQQIDNGVRSWVTVNKMPQTADSPDNPFRIDPRTTQAQQDRTARIRKERDNARVASALADIEKACVTGGNMVPPVIEAVRAYATIGEITDCWRRHFGVFEPVSTF